MAGRRFDGPSICERKAPDPVPGRGGNVSDANEWGGQASPAFIRGPDQHAWTQVLDGNRTGRRLNAVGCWKTLTQATQPKTLYHERLHLCHMSRIDGK